MCVRHGVVVFFVFGPDQRRAGVPCPRSGPRHNVSGSRVRAAQCHDDPANDCGSGAGIVTMSFRGRRPARPVRRGWHAGAPGNRRVGLHALLRRLQPVPHCGARGTPLVARATHRPSLSPCRLRPPLSPARPPPLHTCSAPALKPHPRPHTPHRSTRGHAGAHP